MSLELNHYGSVILPLKPRPVVHSQLSKYLRLWLRISSALRRSQNSIVTDRHGYAFQIRYFHWQFIAAPESPNLHPEIDRCALPCQVLQPAELAAMQRSRMCVAFRTKCRLMHRGAR